MSGLSWLRIGSPKRTPGQNFRKSGRSCSLAISAPSAKYVVPTIMRLCVSVFGPAPWKTEVVCTEMSPSSYLRRCGWHYLRASSVGAIWYVQYGGKNVTSGGNQQVPGCTNCILCASSVQRYSRLPVPPRRTAAVGRQGRQGRQAVRGFVGRNPQARKRLRHKL
jgi:hypothetical protein